MASSFLVVVLATLSCCSLDRRAADSEVILGKEDGEFDFDGLPGAHHEFKLEVGAGREECFYQKASRDAQLYVSYEVLKGGDRNVEFYLKNPDHVVIEKRPWETQGTIELNVDQPGIYEFCFNNEYNRFTSKLVYFLVSTVLTEHWERYLKEINDLQLTASNVTTSLESVQQSLRKTENYQSLSRMNVMKDWYLITTNNSYVKYWSLAQCAVIVLSSAVQVYFVRRLFSIKNVTPTAKPRA